MISNNLFEGKGLLSIDADFFVAGCNLDSSVLVNWTLRLTESGVPLQLSENHGRLIDLLGEQRFDYALNIDYHCDCSVNYLLAGRHTGQISDATVFEVLLERSQISRYIWIYPQHRHIVAKGLWAASWVRSLQPRLDSIHFLSDAQFNQIDANDLNIARIFSCLSPDFSTEHGYHFFSTLRKLDEQIKNTSS